MHFERLKRWHWIAISLVIGITVGFVRNQLEDVGLNNYGFSINTQEQFEGYLLQKLRLANGRQRPLFDNLTVLRVADPTPDTDRGVIKIVRNGDVATATVNNHGYANRDRVTIYGADQEQYNGAFKISNVTASTFDFRVTGSPPSPAEGPSIRCIGPQRLIYIVTGMKYSDMTRKYLPYFFKAPTPYKPIRPPGGRVPSGKAATTQPVGLEEVAETLGLKAPDPPESVVAYLRQMNANYGTTFSYQWWQEPRFRMGCWVIGTFVVVGLIWPTIVNIMAFGSLGRPPEPKRVKLPKPVKAAPVDQAAQARRQAAAMDEVKAMEEQLVAQLEASEAASGPAQPPVEVAPAGPKALTATKLELATGADQPKDEKAFGADDDDYYPTEVHGKKP